MQFLPTDLQKLNTFNLPASANVAVLSDIDQVFDLASIKQSLFFLGGGSNVVMHKTILHYVVQVAIKGKGLLYETDDHYIVQACAGENWHDFVAYCLDQSWPGLENLALIPGTVGAAPVQNIGAYGVELDQLLHSVIAFNLHDNKIHELTAQDCDFAYRDSMFKRVGFGNWLILKVNFKLPKIWQANIDYPDLQKHALLQSNQINPIRIFNAVCDIRRNKLPDPNILPNAGSFFKNPIVNKKSAEALLEIYPDLGYFTVDDENVKLAAGWLIDKAGWRGKSIAAVGMHKNQALVMVNYGGADANEVMALAAQIKSDVKQKFNVTLEQEPVVLG